MFDPDPQPEAGPEPQVVAEGIPGTDLPGPYPVGSYAAQLRLRLRQFARIQLVAAWRLTG